MAHVRNGVAILYKDGHLYRNVLLLHLEANPAAQVLFSQQFRKVSAQIGRGAEGNPWIFKQILHYRETGETLAKPTQHEVKEMMLRHARMQVEYKGGAIGIREMRKHVAWYTAGFPHSAKLRAAINQVESLQELEQMLNEWERG